MVNAWPETLLPAAPLVSGYSQKPEAGLVRTDMDAGLARQRRRFSGTPSRVAVSWVMDGPQLEIFKAFIAHKAGFGSQFFSIRLPLDNGSRTVQARFVGNAPTYDLMQPGTLPDWLVRGELEIKDPPAMSAEVLDVVINIGTDQLDAIVAALDGVTLAAFFTTWEADFGA